jgi:hypothetical protein
MPARRKTAAPAPAAPKALEAQLWSAADKMRGAVPPADYMHVCLGLVFLRYLSAAFERKFHELEATPYAAREDPEEYHADNVFWVPPEARWAALQAAARAPDIGPAPRRCDARHRARQRQPQGRAAEDFRQGGFQPADAWRAHRPLHQPQPHRRAGGFRPARPGLRVFPGRVLGDAGQGRRRAIHAALHGRADGRDDRAVPGWRLRPVLRHRRLLHPVEPLRARPRRPARRHRRLWPGAQPGDPPPRAHEPRHPRDFRRPALEQRGHPAQGRLPRRPLRLGAGQPALQHQGMGRRAPARRRPLEIRRAAPWAMPTSPGSSTSSTTSRPMAARR